MRNNVEFDTLQVYSVNLSRILTSFEVIAKMSSLLKSSLSNHLIVSETLPSDELVQKARGLGLPDHFYNYLELADEEKDDKFPWEKEEEKKETPPVVEEKTIPKPVFGASTGGAFNFGAKNNGNYSLL